VVRRLRVLGIGLSLGALFALWVAGPVMPPGMRLPDRALVWASVMGGPVVGTAWGMADFHPAILLGWLGLLLVPAHPAPPGDRARDGGQPPALVLRWLPGDDGGCVGA
jgi:hypothetical protein